VTQSPPQTDQTPTPSTDPRDIRIAELEAVEKEHKEAVHCYKREIKDLLETIGGMKEKIKERNVFLNHLEEAAGASYNESRVENRSKNSVKQHNDAEDNDVDESLVKQQGQESRN